MKPIREFLLSYADFYAIASMENKVRDNLVIEYMRTSTNNLINPEGYAVAVVGSNILSRKMTVGGDATLRKRVNFQFLIKRHTMDNSQTLELGDFIINFIDWINTENELKTNPLLPKFSDTDYEQIIADGGMQIGSVKPGLDEFVLSLHIEFEQYFENNYF